MLELKGPTDSMSAKGLMQLYPLDTSKACSEGDTMFAAHDKGSVNGHL